MVCDRIVKLVLGDVGFGILERVLSEENEKREKCEATISRWIWAIQLANLFIIPTGSIP